MNVISQILVFLKHLLNDKTRAFSMSRLVIANGLARTITERNHIFIHINKTAGSSISKMLGEERSHLTALCVRDMVGEQVWNDCFKFAIVRNPWDRVVSQYHYRHQNNQQNIKTRGISFKDWVVEVYSKKNMEYINVYSMFMNQLDWVSTMDGEIIVDFIGRYENLEEDISYIQKMLNITGKLPVERRSRRGHYSEYYDQNTKAIVEEAFKRDINYFDYKFVWQHDHS